MKAYILVTALLLLGLTGNALADTLEDEGSEQGGKPAAMAMPTGHPISLPEGLNAKLVELADIPVAYLEGTLQGDMNELFGRLQALAEEQGLLKEDTRWGSAYPDDMSQRIDENTRVFAGITIDPEAEVAEPLLRGTMLGGSYLMVEHRGEYAGLADTYLKLYTWAIQNGVTLAPPSYEHYVNDPGTTPAEDLVTEIYFAFDHKAMKAAYQAEEEAEDNAGSDGGAS